MLYVKGRPVLADPGLLVDESEAASLVGTPGYVPPEKFTEAASDIYSLGLTLKAASFGRKLEDLDKGPALEADTGAPLFPVWWRFLNKATDPTPSRRYQSAKALLKDLKLLRLRMSVTSVIRSWLFFTAIGILVASVVAYAYAASRERNRLESEVGDLRQFKTGWERERNRLESEVDALRQIKTGWENHVEHMKRRAYEGYERNMKALEKSWERQRQEAERMRQEALKK